jgi:hypothetical protein
MSLVPQIDAKLALSRLEAVVGAAEDVCDNRDEVIAVLVSAIATVSAATPGERGAELLDRALSTLMKMRIGLPQSQEAMRLARELHAAGVH